MPTFKFARQVTLGDFAFSSGMINQIQGYVNITYYSSLLRLVSDELLISSIGFQLSSSSIVIEGNWVVGYGISACLTNGIEQLNQIQNSLLRGAEVI